jgi:hypothetical protein
MALEIEEWEIWHTYSTFLESTGIDLPEGARRLVASGIAECAMLRDGRTFWRSNDAIGSGSTAVGVDSASGLPVFHLELDENCKAQPEGFALEAWGQGSYFLVSERRVLGEEAALPPAYLRAYLGKCLLTSTSPDGTNWQLSLYPVLIVYESGVMMVEFRMIGPKTVRALSDFIADDVNLFKHRFDRVEVTPGLAAFAARAYNQPAYQGNFARRLRFMRLMAGHNIAVRQRTERQTDEDLSFDLAPLSGSESDDLKSIALTIFHTAAFILGRPRMGLSFLLWGHLPAPAWGEFWSGRPHVHLVRFRKQCKTASENEACHGSDFGRILSRVFAVDEAAARLALPRDARLLQDYNAYIIRSCSLWVWSADGLSGQAAWMDPNRGNLIYERQVLAELLEYGYMLHRSLYHRLAKFSTTAEVISVRRQVLQLRRKMLEASHSGEVLGLLESGWNELGLPDLVSEIDTGLRLRESETRSIEALRSTRVGWALTVVFGLVAVPALADQVIQPLWKLTSFRQFTDASLATVVSDGIAMLIVLLVLWVTFSVISPREG